MQFEKAQLYHIYNQGNNRQRVFFCRENYLFFLKKVSKCFFPFADVLAWCLMPNHFHFMVLVNKLEVFSAASNSPGDSESPGEFDASQTRTLNQSIAILLRSYTRAINKQQGTSGSLFRQKTKAECLTCPGEITPSFMNTKAGTVIDNTPPEKQYPQVCFNYIHQNPVVAGLAERNTDWEFSSARDYYGNREGKLINKEKAKEYISW